MHVLKIIRGWKANGVAHEDKSVFENSKTASILPVKAVRDKPVMTPIPRCGGKLPSINISVSADEIRGLWLTRSNLN